MLRSGNPVLNDSAFESQKRYYGPNAMTLSGTINKTGILLTIAFVTAAYVWTTAFSNMENLGAITPFIIAGSIGGFIMAIVTTFKKEWSPVTAPIYAALQGLSLGGISSFFEMRYPGLVIQAVALTYGVAFALLLAYRSGLIKATENLQLGVVAATGGIALIYLIGIVLSFFGLSIPLIHQSGPIGIGFSLVVVAVAAFSLVLDFDFIETASESNSPKYMEWYGAFGLVVTLFWLYFEMLRLLSKLQDRR